MVRIKRSYRIQVCRETRSQWRAPLGSSADRHRPDTEVMPTESSLRVLRRQALRNTSAARAARRQALLPFRSLDPFRALREPDRRRRGEERLTAPNKEPTNQPQTIT